MRKPFTIGALTALIFAVPGTGWVVRRSMNADHEMKLAVVQAAWEKERAAQPAALKNARARKEPAAVPVVAPVVASAPGAAELIAELRARSAGSGTPVRRARMAIHAFEELITRGPICFCLPELPRNPHPRRERSILVWPAARQNRE